MRRHWGLTKEEAEAMIKAFNFESLFQISILNEPPLLFKIIVERDSNTSSATKNKAITIIMLSNRHFLKVITKLKH